MLVIENKKKIVLPAEETHEAIKVLPHARTLQHNGQNLLAVNHGTEEAIVLKNLGMKIPEPIRTYYSWPGRFKPMAHQVETAAFLTINKRALCLNDPGLGKSISALWAADYLIEEGVAHRVLIVAPLSTVNVVWAKELYQHFPHRSFAVLTGSRKQRLEKLEIPGLQFAIINHDGFTSIYKELVDFDVVIYDEATALKTPSSQRFRIFSKWVNTHGPWLWLLTGTPFSQSPVDAWALARLVNSPTVPRSFTTFKEMVMQRVSTFKWVPRKEALEICKQVLQPSIRFSLDECTDIPQTHYIDRETSLTVQQAKAFKQMQDWSLVQLGGTDISAANAAVMLGKLLQICCGVVYDGDGETVEIDAAPRYEALVELLEEIGDKTIVFCPLRSVQDWLQDKLTADGYDVAKVNGSTTKTERNVIFNDFQNSDRIQILLAHPKVAAHGLTLTRAKHIIWYAPIYSLEQYEQANARIRRISTEGKTTVWHIYATPFEQEMYRRLKHKQSVLKDFLNLVKGVNE